MAALTGLLHGKNRETLLGLPAERHGSVSQVIRAATRARAANPARDYRPADRHLPGPPRGRDGFRGDNMFALWAVASIETFFVSRHLRVKDP